MKSSKQTQKGGGGEARQITRFFTRPSDSSSATAAGAGGINAGGKKAGGAVQPGKGRAEAASGADGAGAAVDAPLVMPEIDQELDHDNGSTPLRSPPPKTTVSERSLVPHHAAVKGAGGAAGSKEQQAALRRGGADAAHPALSHFHGLDEAASL